MFFFSFPLIWTLVISFSSVRLIFFLSWFHWSITEELKQRKYEQRRVLGAHDYYWLDQTTHPSLRHLDLSDCPHLSAEGLRQILDLFPGLVHLVPVVSWRGNICGLKKWTVRTGVVLVLFFFLCYLLEKICPNILLTQIRIQLRFKNIITWMVTFKQIYKKNHLRYLVDWMCSG